jgi:hypothetical protein
MGALTISPPYRPEDEPISSEFMILDDEFVVTNISSSEIIEINMRAPILRMRPGTNTNSIRPVTVKYIAQAMCDKEDFRIFYKSRLGKSIKMIFEMKMYFGYLTDLVIGHEDVEFSFTHTQKTNVTEVDLFRTPLDLI